MHFEDGEVVHLARGDSLYFEGRSGHAYVTVSRQLAKIVGVRRRLSLAGGSASRDVRDSTSQGPQMNSSRELSATVFALLLPLAASAADFQVIVSDGPTTPATLYVALFDTAEAFTADKPLAAQKVPLRDVKTLLFDAPDTWRAQFDASSAPWKSAFATPKGDRPLTAAKVRGRFPDAVAGTLYRIGPAATTWAANAITIGSMTTA